MEYVFTSVSEIRLNKTTMPLLSVLAKGDSYAAEIIKKRKNSGVILFFP